MVLSRVVPTEPPTCWAVLTMAEAMPASVRLTPRVAVANEAEEMPAAPAPAGNEPRQHLAGVAPAGSQPGENDHGDEAQDHAGHYYRPGTETRQDLGLDQRRGDDDGAG